VTLEAGKHYAFDASLPAAQYGAQPAITVLDAGGAEVAKARWFLNKMDTLGFSPAVSGTYYLQMASVADYYSDKSAGAYSVSVRQVEADDHPAIEDATLGVEVRGRHEITSDVDTFRYTFAANTYYRVDASLFDASGKPVDDSFTSPVNFDWLGSQTDQAFRAYQTGGVWIIKPANAGVYTASVSSANAAAYRFTVTSLGLDDVPDSSKVPRVEVGGQVRGTLEAPGDQDSFVVKLQAGQTVNVALSGAASGAGSIDFARVPQTLGVLSRSGSMPALSTTQGDVHHALFTASAAGDYVIYLGQFAPRGTYTVSVHDVSNDTVKPELMPGLSAGGAAGQDVRGNIVLQFSEAIMRGGATAGLFDAAGAQLDWFYPDTPGRMTVVGSTLTLDPSRALAPGAGYTVKLAATGVKDLAGNPLAGPLEFAFRTAAAATAPGDGNTVYQGSLQGARIDGGAGLDTAYYAGQETQYTFVRKDGGFAVSRPGGGGTADLLVGVERVMFDGALMKALDIDGVGGRAYRIYQAAFDRTPDMAGLGYWIAMMDKGVTLDEVAAGFVASNEFKGLYGANPTHLELVTRLYTNVLHRPGDAGGIDFWVGALDKGVSLASVLAGFSESAENVEGLLPLIGNGFSYQPWG
jgi:hypothetical protein